MKTTHPFPKQTQARQDPPERKESPSEVLFGEYEELLLKTVQSEVLLCLLLEESGSDL